MPTYVYKCPNGHEYETRESFDSPPRQECIHCGQIAKRVLFAPPIVFKGSGFYITDSRKGSSATIGADGGSTPSTSTEKSNGSTPTPSNDTKPAATAAASDD